MAYTLSQATYTRLKSRLTGRINKFNKARILHRASTHDAKLRTDLGFHAGQLVAECDYANKIFDAQGWPDSWSNWARAKEDAELQLRLIGGRN